MGEGEIIVKFPTKEAGLPTEASKCLHSYSRTYLLLLIFGDQVTEAHSAVAFWIKQSDKFLNHLLFSYSHLPSIQCFGLILWIPGSKDAPCNLKSQTATPVLSSQLILWLFFVFCRVRWEHWRWEEWWVQRGWAEEDHGPCRQLLISRSLSRCHTNTLFLTNTNNMFLHVRTLKSHCSGLGLMVICLHTQQYCNYQSAKSNPLLFTYFRGSKKGKLSNNLVYLATFTFTLTSSLGKKKKRNSNDLKY